MMNFMNSTKIGECIGSSELLGTVCIRNNLNTGSTVSLQRLGHWFASCCIVLLTSLIRVVKCNVQMECCLFFFTEQI